MESSMSRFLLLFTAGYLFFIALDTVFLGYVMRNVYQREIGALARSVNNQMSILVAPGLIVWALIVLGALVFVLPRCIEASVGESFLWGAFYGLILYGVYDLTNYAVLAHWTLWISIIDCLWGMLANGLLLMLLSTLNKHL